MDAAATWSLFDEIAAEVRDRVDALGPAHRLAEGDRPGQYRLDLHADEVVVERLVGAGFGVLSEESGRHHPEREICVVVDPVDGSTNASRGLPCWATSLCAVDTDGLAVATVVDQSRGVTYRAARGQGAFRSDGNGGFAPIAVAAPVPLGESILAVNGDSSPRPASRQFRALGAAAVEICLVAEGVLDGYVNLDGDSHGPWDYAGALLVVLEAGGVAADFDGRPLVSTEHTARRRIAVASGVDLLTAMMHR